MKNHFSNGKQLLLFDLGRNVRAIKSQQVIIDSIEVRAAIRP
jgi:hypothetical protein